MTGMEAAIRGALDKAGIPGAQARRRIYDSARGALDRSLERQGVTDPGQIDEHRHRLEALIASIEAEWAAPGEASTAAPGVSAVPVEPAITRPEPPISGFTAAPEIRSPQPETPRSHAPQPDTGWPEADRPMTSRPPTSRPMTTRQEPGMGDRRAEPSWSHAAGPAAAPEIGPAVGPSGAPGAQPASPRAAAGPDASLDFVPDAHRSDPPAKAPGFTAERREPERRPEISPELDAGQVRATKPAKPAKPAKAAKAGRGRDRKKPRGVFAGLFSTAVMVSFLGMGIWWAVDSGLFMTAAERDTSVPNPPPSFSRDDFAGGPRQLNPGSGFSGDWSNVFTPGRDGTPQPRSSAEASLVDQPEGTALRIVSRNGGADGEVLVPLGADVMQALAGRKSMLALTVRSASPDTTQIYVKCQFSVLGECGRHRFDVSYDTTDVLFTLDYDRALAPNEGGNLIINSDISGGGKGIDLLAVRIRPLG
ncbi:hypothetical protein [Hoeflea olei]|uniref:Biotin transporter BioY n=1 Tax=Hoeflea olei TaxID=1480615 RepID=A0A1C1YSH1_9HYPH|nr:hypothetical protein [Hoeflea olei]OCW56444.1 hypothetical protein AWJ14_20440 [Hoeflea olei]